MNHLYLDADRGHLIATNGKVITVVKVRTDPDDVSGLIPVSVIRYAREVYSRGPVIERKLDGKKRPFDLKEAVFLKCGADHLTIKGAQKESFRFPRPKGDFPEIANGIPSPASFGLPLAVVDVDFMIDMLTAFKNCMKGERNEQVALYLSAEAPATSPLCFAVLDGDSIGLVMPIETNADPASVAFDRTKIGAKAGNPEPVMS
jgi:hypothetical protein